MALPCVTKLNMVFFSSAEMYVVEDDVEDEDGETEEEEEDTELSFVGSDV